MIGGNLPRRGVPPMILFFTQIIAPILVGIATALFTDWLDRRR
ncbi:type I toxin-antitoxin system Fst family toxin [Lacticaseibacillus sp. 53-4]